MNHTGRPLELQLKLTLLTPAFIRGAGDEVDGDPAELRAASLRGLLRYWFRAVYGSGTERGPAMDRSPGADTSGGRDVGSRAAMPEVEALLFGSTKWAGVVRVVPMGSPPNVLTPPAPGTRGDWPELFGNSTKERPDRGYLWYSAKINGRSCFPPREEVGLRVLIDLARLRAGRVAGWSEVELLSAVGRSLAAWAVFGGIGLRSRRTAGAFRTEIRHIEGDVSAIGTVVGPLKAALDALAKSTEAAEAGRGLRALFVADKPDGRNAARPEYHAMTPGRFYAGVWAEDGRSFESARRTADVLARVFRDGRRANRQNWDAVHAIDAGESVPQPVPIVNAVFGLPLMYRFTHGNRSKFDIEAKLPEEHRGGNERRETRRASPLFFTVRQIGTATGEGGFAVVWCAFDSRYLPAGSRLLVQRRWSVVEPEFSTVVELLRRCHFIEDAGGDR